MARKKIREFDAKSLLYTHLEGLSVYKGVLIDESTDFHTLPNRFPWLNETSLVVKPDQLFGKRKKHGLVLLNCNFHQAIKWIEENLGKEVSIGKATDKLTHFLIEPYVEHSQEYYVAIKSHSKGEDIFFSDKGGIDIEENWDKVQKIEVSTLDNSPHFSNIKELKIQNFIKSLFRIFRELNFTYLELNPFIIKNNLIHLLDTVSHIDSCARFKNQNSWGNLEFPKSFGKQQFPEEEMINKIDEESGASLKLTVLNPKGRIWTILAGGGASIIYLDMIANLGKGNEIANYGDLAGGPTTMESYLYAKTVFELMTKEKDPRGKILFILGCIANFTDVKKTFKGFIQALEEYQDKLKSHNVKVFIRRGGPNHKEGLKLIKETGEKLNIPMFVHGPETSMEKIINIAGEHL